MLASIMGSLSSLFWSLIMTSLIIYVFAIFFVQQMAIELDRTRDEMSELWKEQRYFFRTVQRTGLTLLQSTMGGLDWQSIYLLIEPLGELHVAAFLFYIVFFNFAVVNILTGIFLENAMKLCKPEPHEIAEMDLKQDEEHGCQLRNIMMNMDSDHYAIITKHEFRASVTDSDTAKRFAEMGIDLSDPNLFFQMLVCSVSTERVTVDTFVDGAMAMRGMASGDCPQLDVQGAHRLHA